MKLMPLNALLTKYCWSAGLSAESMGSSDRPSAWDCCGAVVGRSPRECAPPV